MANAITGEDGRKALWRPDWRERLNEITQALRRRPFGLITDCDGTISHIATTPAEAGVDARCRAALRELAGRIDLVAVVSGRTVENVREMVGLDGVVYVGNHGLERWQDGDVVVAAGADRYRPVIAEALARAQEDLADLDLAFENKGVTGAIHYRRSRRPRLARQAILGEVARLAERTGLHIVEGKRVVELRPPLGVDKGKAVVGLVEDHGLRGGLYFGDDRSDVPALRAMRHLRRQGASCHGVGVVGAETPRALLAAADFVALGVADVAAALEWIAANA